MSEPVTAPSPTKPDTSNLNSLQDKRRVRIGSMLVLGSAVLPVAALTGWVLNLVRSKPAQAPAPRG